MDPAMQRHYDELVQLCYECVLDESRWDVLLERLLALSGRQQGGVVIQARGERYGKVTQYHRCSEEAVQRYADHFHRLDPGLDCMPQRQVGLWYHDWEHLSANTLKLHPYYQEFMRPLDMGHNSYVKLYETPSHNAYLTLITERCCSTPEASQQELLEQLSPHLRLAGAFASHLATLTNRLHHQSLLLEYSNHCCWLVDGQGRLAFASQRGEALLQQPGAPLRIQQGRLRARHDGVPLGKTIQRAAGVGGPPCAGLVRLDEPQRRCLLVVPVTPSLLPHDSPPLVLLTLSDRAMDQERARDLFKFTPAETRLAQLLVDGLSPEACAIKLQVSITTVRSQLRALLRKTETERQAELVAMLGRVASG